MDGVMTNRERFSRVLRYEPVDRLPVFEWAPWWDQTIERWHREGLPENLGAADCEAIRDYFGMDAHQDRKSVV